MLTQLLRGLTVPLDGVRELVLTHEGRQLRADQPDDPEEGVRLLDGAGRHVATLLRGGDTVVIELTGQVVPGPSRN